MAELVMKTKQLTNYLDIDKKTKNWVEKENRASTIRAYLSRTHKYIWLMAVIANTDIGGTKCKNMNGNQETIPEVSIGWNTVAHNSGQHHASVTSLSNSFRVMRLTWYEADSSSHQISGIYTALEEHQHRFHAVCTRTANDSSLPCGTFSLHGNLDSRFYSVLVLSPLQVAVSHLVSVFGSCLSWSL